MHTFRHIGDKWLVGFYEPIVTWATETIGVPDVKWHTVKTCSGETEAAAWVSYLNGGARPQ